MRQGLRVGFTLGLSFVLASCAVRSGAPPTQQTTMGTLEPPGTCTVTVFPGAPLFSVEDLGPIQGACPDSTRHWSTCGIDQANLLDIACSSGADTVFGLYEVVTPAQHIFSRDQRVMHARLGRRRTEVGQASANQAGDRLK